MALTTEELDKSFTVKIDEDKGFIEIIFNRNDLDSKEVDIQSDLIVKIIMDCNNKFPGRKGWKILVDTATNKVLLMTKYSKKNYEKITKLDGAKKVAILVDNSEKQGVVTAFVLSIYTKLNKKMNMFTSREEAMIWLDI